MSSDEETRYFEDVFDEQYDSENYEIVNEVVNEEAKSKSGPTEIPFEVMENDQIKSKIDKIIEDIKSVTRFPLHFCRILLHQYSWNKQKLLEDYGNSEDPEEFLKKNEFKFPLNLISIGSLKTMEEGICNICIDKAILTGLSCDHYFCILCWDKYLWSQLYETADPCVFCPETDCKHIVNDALMMNLLKKDEDKKFYKRKWINSFVEGNKSLKWCPAPDCDKIIKLHNPEFKMITCRCSHSFCFNCSDDWHEPIPCEYLKKWRNKCQSNEETVNWITVNTKNCPKCHVTIEKYGELCFMECICKFEFCWYCLKPKDLHDSCDSVIESNDEEDKYKERAKTALNRYLHYYDSFNCYQQDLELGNFLMDQITDKSCFWKDSKFLTYAIDVLKKCQRTIMYSCAFAFYLKSNDFVTEFQIMKENLISKTNELNELLMAEIDPAVDNLGLLKCKVKMSSDEETRYFEDVFDEQYDSENYEVVNEEAKPKSKLTKIPFEVLDGDQVKSEIHQTVEEITSVTQLLPQFCQILLHRYHWNKEKLLENYYENENFQDIFKGKRLEFPLNLISIGSFETIEEGICNICIDKAILTGLSCGHYFCTLCWDKYLWSQLYETADPCVFCPETDCKHIVNDALMMNLLKKDEDKKFYERKWINNFVERNNSLKWCPAPDCGKIIKLHNPEFKMITCRCSHSFCFNCSDDWHEPIPCEYLKKWRNKCQSNEETVNWITVNTKNCPKCHVTIEKYGGCNYMSCVSCGMKFCWVCLKPMDSHNSCCNFMEKNNGEAPSKAKARMSLNRYLHHYNHFVTYEKLIFDSNLMNQVDVKVKEMLNENFSQMEVESLIYAAEILHKCQMLLMYSYVFAFYLKSSNFSIIFEINQKNLELIATELNKILMKQIDPNVDNLSLFIKKIENKSYYIEKRCKIFLDLCNEGVENEQLQLQDLE